MIILLNFIIVLKSDLIISIYDFTRYEAFHASNVQSYHIIDRQIFFPLYINWIIPYELTFCISQCQLVSRCKKIHLFLYLLIQLFKISLFFGPCIEYVMLYVSMSKCSHLFPTLVYFLEISSILCIKSNVVSRFTKPKISVHIYIYIYYSKTSKIYLCVYLWTCKTKTLKLESPSK